MEKEFQTWEYDILTLGAQFYSICTSCKSHEICLVTHKKECRGEDTTGEPL